MKKNKTLLIAILTFILTLSLCLVVACNNDSTSKKTFTITFDSNGGSEIATQTVVEGENVIKPQDPSKTGYTFICWELEGTEYNFTTAPSTDLTLRAKWEANKYTLFLGEGSKQVTYNQEIGELPPVPSVSGKTGVWKIGDTEISAETVWNFTENKTAEAKYDLITYTISYILDDGTNGDNPTTYTIETATITLKDASKSGYKFCGWFNNEMFEGDAITEIAQGSTGDKTFYAKFMVACTVTFDVNGGVALDPVLIVSGTKISELAQYTTTKIGYKLDGWTYSNGEEIPAETTITGPLTVKAKWGELSPSDISSGTRTRLVVSDNKLLDSLTGKVGIVAAYDSVAYGTNIMGLDGKIDFTNNKSIYGEKTIIVVDNNNDAYKMDLLIINGIITSGAEMRAMYPQANALIGSDNDLTYGGYWELGADIDDYVDEKGEIYTKPYLLGDYANNGGKNIGWLGTFDGRGHTISNITFDLDGCGLFGSIGGTGVIKNVSINCYYARGRWTGLLAAEVWGTIKNVRVFTQISSWWTDNQATGVLCKELRDGAVIDSVILDVASQDWGVNGYVSGFGAVLAESDGQDGYNLTENVTITNCLFLGYAHGEVAGIGSSAFFNSGEIVKLSNGKWNQTHVELKDKFDIIEVYQWTLSEANTDFAGKEYDMSNWDTSVWTIDGYNLPVMKVMG